MQVKGHLNVLGKNDVGLRVNEGLTEKNLTTTESLTALSTKWQKFTMTGAQDCILPDATTLPKGWEVVIHNADASDTLTVKDNSNNTLKSISAGKAYCFTCVDNNSVAGVWYITSMPTSDMVQADRYSVSFNATSNWTDAGTTFTYTVLASAHGKGTTPIFQVQELSGGEYFDVILQDAKVNANGDITLIVSKNPDARFAGRIIVL